MLRPPTAFRDLHILHLLAASYHDFVALHVTPQCQHSHVNSTNGIRQQLLQQLLARSWIQTPGAFPPRIERKQKDGRPGCWFIAGGLLDVDEHLLNEVCFSLSCLKESFSYARRRGVAGPKFGCEKPFFPCVCLYESSINLHHVFEVGRKRNVFLASMLWDGRRGCQ